MERTILVPLDGSPLAERALPYATALARATGAGISLVRASLLHRQPGGDSEEERARELESAYLTSLARRLERQGLEVDTVLRPEEAPDAILAEATDRRADLIVMATHGRGGLGRRLLGSVAAGVLDRPPAPVLLVPLGPVRAGWPAPGTRPRLLVPLDGSAFAEAALPLAGEVAAALGGELTLLRAVPPGGAAGGAVPPAPRQGARPGEQPPAPDGRAAEARAYLRAAADRLPAGAGAPQLAVRWGEPADAIAAEARERAVGLVVMATHGYTDPRRALLGSVAEAVVARCALPLLLLRPRTPRALGDAPDAEG